MVLKSLVRFLFILDLTNLPPPYSSVPSHVWTETTGQSVVFSPVVEGGATETVTIQKCKKKYKRTNIFVMINISSKVCTFSYFFF